MRGTWIREPKGNTCVIFVHGILSSGESCWRNRNGTYWPELLGAEAELTQLGIYVFTYQTGIFSGDYRISDVVDALKEFLGLDEVLACHKLIFVCHSMGGIVVRKYLVERAADLIAGRHEIELFLVASPSLGAAYADWLAPLANMFGHAHAAALRLVSNNHWLQDLDKEFRNLKEGGQLPLRGKELVEDKFIILPKLWRDQIVKPFSGQCYFGEPVRIPGSDHFSIAKPEGAQSFQHRLLCGFIKHKTVRPPAVPQAGPSEAIGNSGFLPQPPAKLSGAGVHVLLCTESACGPFATDLASRLQLAGESCWTTATNIQDHRDPLQQLDEALRSCASLIVVLGPAAPLNAASRIACDKAISYAKPITVVHTAERSDYPLQLESRKRICFGPDAPNALRVLIDRLRSFATPLGQWEHLSEQLVFLRCAAEFATGANKQRYDAEIATIEQQYLSLGASIERATSTNQRIARNLELERHPARADMRTASLRQLRVVNAPPLPVPHYFENRYAETALIADFLRDLAASVLTVHGRGGVGKTALVCRVLYNLESNQLPDNGGALKVASVIYMNALGATSSLCPRMLSAILSTLDATVQEKLRPVLENPAANTATRLLELLAHLPADPTVVLIDNFEDLISEASTIHHAEIREFLRVLTEHPRHMLKCILTTRLVPVEISRINPARQFTISLVEGLESPYAERVLQKLDFDGSVGLRGAHAGTLRRIVDVTRGFPRAMEAFYSLLLSDPSKEINDVIEEVTAAVYPSGKLIVALVGEAYSRLLPMEKKVMEAIAVFGCPISPTAIEYVLDEWASYIDSATVLKRLVALHFVRRKDGQFFLHPIDREHAFGFVSEEDRQTLRQRAADYFREIQRPQREWKVLDDVEPYLHEFQLRLEAQDVFAAERILDRIGNFLLKRCAFSQTLALADQLLDLAGPAGSETALRYKAEAHWRLGASRAAVQAQERILELCRQQAPGVPHPAEEGNLLIYRLSLGVTDELLEAFKVHFAQWEARAPGDSENLAICLDHLGDSYQELGYAHEGLTCALRAKTLAFGSSDTDHKEAMVHNLGVRYQNNGDMELAEDCYRQALALAEETRNPLWKANHLSSLAMCEQATGRQREARKLMDEALELRQEIGDLRGIAENLKTKAEFLLDAGLLESAVCTAVEAWERARNLDMPLLQFACMLAEVHIARNDWESALEVLHGGQSDSAVRRWHFHNLFGIVMMRRGARSIAKGYFDKAVAQCDIWLARAQVNLNAQNGRALGLAGLAACGNADALDQAITCYRRALPGVGAGTQSRWKRQLAYLLPGSIDGSLGGIVNAVFGNV